MDCTIHIKVETADKGLMIQRLNETRRAELGRRKNELGDDRHGEDVETTNFTIPPLRTLEPDSTWVTMQSGTHYAQAEDRNAPSPNWPVRGSWSEGEGMLYV
jgi:hypothetical protein